MTKFIFILAFNLVAILLANSCSSRNASPLNFSDSRTQGNQEIQERTSYQIINQQILIPKCLSCHGSSSTVNLETYPAVYGHIARIKQETLALRKMPKLPYTPLTTKEYNLLSAWIASGAPEKPLDGGDDLPAPTIEPLTPTFSSIKKNIFQNKCLICHSAGKEAERVSLNSAEDLINSPLDLVVPGNPDDSGLILSVLPNARKIMPPKKTGIEFLKPEEIEVVKQWIENGAKD